MADDAPTLKRVQSLARRLLKERPDAIVRYRLLRDVLRVEPGSLELRRAKRAMLASPQVKALAGEQLADGSWGRLHSRDTKVQRAVPTTEAGVQRALDLGLSAGDAILRRAAAYLGRVLRGAARVPDPPEKNSRWPAGVALFAGATLALIDPGNSALDDLYDRWSQVLARTFASGRFDCEAEAQAQHEIHGVDLREGVKYLGLANRYAVALLGGRAEKLPPRLIGAYFGWLIRKRDGIGYLNQPVIVRQRRLPRGRELAAWLGSIHLLLRFRHLADIPPPQALTWLWRHRNPGGLWDFGPRASDLRLSPSWRNPAARRHDHSTHVLVLLARLLGDQ